MATVTDIYTTWKPTVLGKGIDIDKAYGDQCVDVDLSYGQSLFPGVPWQTVFPPTAYAKDLGKTHNLTYFDWIINDHSNPNQLPIQGDVLVCDATPQPGYSNTFTNVAGHTGVVDSANASGYTIVMQDGTDPNGKTFKQTQPWKYRPVLGWLRPKVSSTPTPPPAPQPTAHTITLPATTGPWHLYKVGGPYNPNVAANVKGILVPSQFGGLTYPIIADRGNGVYTINSQDYGQGDLWTNGSDVVVK